jgi:hypothetical protein
VANFAKGQMQPVVKIKKIITMPKNAKEINIDFPHNLSRGVYFICWLGDGANPLRVNSGGLCDDLNCNAYHTYHIIDP